MKRIDVDAVDPDSIGDDADRRRLSESLGATDVAVNHYRIGPGEGFPGGLHAHRGQEELFVVLDGEATFETLGREDDRGAGEVVVGAGEAVRFAPGEYKSGRNDADGDLVALALGAPPDSEDVWIPLDCPDCGHTELALSTDGDGVALDCPDCGVEWTPQPCPECGSPDLEAALGEGTTVVARCRDCSAAFAEAPLER